MFSCYVIGVNLADDRHPVLGVVGAAAILIVTAVIAWLGVTGRAHRPSIVAADLAVCVLLTLFTRVVQTPTQYSGGTLTLTTVWAAGPVIEWGLVGGWSAGVIAGLVQFAASAVVRGDWHDGHTLTNGALLVIVGGVAGYVSRLTVRAERELASAAARQAALSERERLTRSIHDGALQVLGLVHRTGRDSGEPWQPIALAAAEQEVALRNLMTTAAGAGVPRDRLDGSAGSPSHEPVEIGKHGQRRDGRYGDADELGEPDDVDLGRLLAVLRTPAVTVSVPGYPIELDGESAGELHAIAVAALHNVTQHAGSTAHAWVLLEDAGTDLLLTIRDDGAGMPADRLAEAERLGRLGVSGSIRARAVALGGTVQITSALGAGTEIEVTLPRDKLPHGDVPRSGRSRKGVR